MLSRKANLIHRFHECGLKGHFQKNLVQQALPEILEDFFAFSKKEKNLQEITSWPKVNHLVHFPYPASMDFPLLEVFEEYGLLRKILSETFEEKQFVSAINSFVDYGIAQTAAGYLDHNEAKNLMMGENLRRVINNVPVILWAMDLQGKITLSKGSGLEKLGYRPGELVGQSVYTLYKDNPDLVHNITRSLAGEAFVVENHIFGDVWLETQFAPLKNHRQELVGSVGISVDISHRKLAEAKLEALTLEMMSQAEMLENLYEQSQDAVRVRDEFLSIASHELKTPLTSLKLQIQLIKRLLGNHNFLGSGKVSQLIEEGDRQINGLTSLVEDMLDITRINSGVLSLRVSPMDFTQMIKEVVGRLSEQLHTAGCEVKMDLPKALPGNWDRFRLEQVVTNLISNAMKYGGGRPIEITLRLCPQGNSLILTIKDNGIGIAEEDRERIFQRFERAVGPHEMSGLGLGLYIVRQILQAHGGSIRVESKINEGSTFIIKLPVPSVARTKVSFSSFS